MNTKVFAVCAPLVQYMGPICQNCGRRMYSTCKILFRCICHNTPKLWLLYENTIMMMGPHVTKAHLIHHCNLLLYKQCWSAPWGQAFLCLHAKDCSSLTMQDPVSQEGLMTPKQPSPLLTMFPPASHLMSINNGCGFLHNPVALLWSHPTIF